jgi:hypothetical protein
VEYQVNVSLLNGSSTPGMRTAFRDRLVRLGCEGVIVRHNSLNGVLTARFLLRGTAQPQVAGRAERLVRKALEEAHIQAQLLMLGAARLATA